MALRYLITGATGFIGGHIAEACVSAGSAVSALARPGSDTALLERFGVAIHRGDLNDCDVLDKAAAATDVVVHGAAKVGDRGPVEDYRQVNVEGLRNLLEACKGRPLHRFVHLSSLGVYEARHHHGTDESEPAAIQHWDGYTQSKAEAEQVVRHYRQEHGVPVVILRPGFVYGPRDRAVLPKLIDRLRQDRMHYLGGGKRALNTIYIGNLVDAVFLAVDKPQAVGQIYNLTDGELVSKERFINAIADAIGCPQPRQRMPLWLAGLAARVLRWQMRRAGPSRKPWLTPAKYKFLLLNLDFSIAKARRELGYGPRISFDQGIQETMAWYKQNA